jgi:8-oxo-dGTP pyrophosphatase MutT (NUDIX family)
MRLCYLDEGGREWEITFQADDEGRLVSANPKVGLGCVLMVSRSAREWLMVQKAPRAEYEFGGLWAFPGGMVRIGSESHDLDSVVLSSLTSRVREETGIDVGEAVFERVGCPVVTAYTVRGSKRYTLVLPYGAGPLPEENPSVAPRPLHGSVSAAEWRQVPGLWDEVTPASCIFAGRHLWRGLTAEEREEALGPLAAALSQCDKWAEEVGLHRTGRWWDFRRGT